MQVGTETCKKNLCVQHVHVLTELPFLHTTIAGCATMAPFTYIVGEGVFMYSTVLHTVLHSTTHLQIKLHYSQNKQNYSQKLQ